MTNFYYFIVYNYILYTIHRFIFIFYLFAITTAIFDFLII
jgi:hypothetical protein